MLYLYMSFVYKSNTNNNNKFLGGISLFVLLRSLTFPLFVYHDPLIVPFRMSLYDYKYDYC